jgi:hypothetical protein
MNSLGCTQLWNSGVSSLKPDSTDWPELIQGVDACALCAPQKGLRLHPPHVRHPLPIRAVRVYVNFCLDHSRWKIDL